MMEKEPRIVVVGPGAIGGAMAALLAREGRDVTLVCKRPELAEKVSAEGLRVTGARGEATVRMPAVARIEDLRGSFDFALVAVKAPQLPDAARRLAPFLREDSLVVSMQNGICIDALSAEVGAGRAVGCVVGWGSTLVEPGVIDITSGGEMVIGMPTGQDFVRLELLRLILDGAFPTRTTTAIVNELYSKLVVNSCITSLGALCGLSLGRMLARSDVRALFIAIMREAIAVADSLSLHVPAYGGRLDYYRFLRGSGPAAELRRQVFLRVFGFAYRRLRSSSLQSLERGRKTEIDYLNGYIQRRGAEKGVPTPVNARVVALVKEIEAGHRRIDVSNLRDLTDSASTRRG
jgi:2-dehydropantoate 2-reductase